jgi:hypothetical protein
VFFKNKVFDTTEDESQFASVPVGMSYKQAIQMMQDGKFDEEKSSR